MTGEPRTREVTLREMVEAMRHLPDDATFRWYQTSFVRSDVDGDAVICAGDTLRVTLGQARRELGIGKP